MARDVALVTGGSSGLGLAFARLLARQGREVVLVARDARRLEAARDELARETGAVVSVLSMDLTEADAPRQLMHRLDDEDWQVGLLVNNAGIGAVGPVAQSDSEALERLLHLNVVAATSLATLAAERMVGKGGGAMINVSSMFGYHPIPNNAVYAASKAYLTSFSLALAMELKPMGIAVLTLCPGQIGGTRFVSRMGGAASGDGGAGLLGLHGADEVASMALQALRQGRDVLVPGWRNRLFCFFLSKLPWAVRKKILQAKYC